MIEFKTSIHSSSVAGEEAMTRKERKRFAVIRKDQQSEVIFTNSTYSA